MFEGFRVANGHITEEAFRRFEFWGTDAAKVYKACVHKRHISPTAAIMAINEATVNWWSGKNLAEFHKRVFQRAEELDSKLQMAIEPDMVTLLTRVNELERWKRSRLTERLKRCLESILNQASPLLW